MVHKKKSHAHHRAVFHTHSLVTEVDEEWNNFITLLQANTPTAPTVADAGTALSSTYTTPSSSTLTTPESVNFLDSDADEEELFPTFSLAEDHHHDPELFRLSDLRPQLDEVGF
jgi:hypothetical protein